MGTIIQRWWMGLTGTRESPILISLKVGKRRELERYVTISGQKVNDLFLILLIRESGLIPALQSIDNQITDISYAGKKPTKFRRRVWESSFRYSDTTQIQWKRELSFSPMVSVQYVISVQVINM